jgi:hypothetical protein
MLAPIRLTRSSVSACAYQVGLLGSNSKVVWVGNIPEGSAQDSNIRLLFAGCGDIRRVYMRRKKSPSMSWCLLMFRASESATVALTSDPPTVVDSDGSTVQLAVEHPNIEKELTKANPGALGQVVGQALTDSLDDAETSPKNKTRRRSAAEIDIRSSVTSDQTVEMVSALGSEQATKRAGWNRIRKASVKKKIAVAAMFVQNDDANEKAAKVAIGAKMKIVTASEPEITNTVRALAELYHGELRGLDYRFKTEASLFRKVMSRLDATLAETALSKEHTPTPTPADILESILDVLRYTAVSLDVACTQRSLSFASLVNTCAYGRVLSATGVPDERLHNLCAEEPFCSGRTGLQGAPRQKLLVRAPWPSDSCQ